MNIFNPIIVSVIILCVLCLCKLNVLLAMLVACIVGGLAGGLNLDSILSNLFSGFASNAETALAYILLGTFAAAMSSTGISDIISTKLLHVIKKRRFVLLFFLSFIACLSQNVIPIHIAFIPILVPPLLVVMNNLKIDRRGAACALAFGLEAPYIAVPVGYGLIFQGIIAKNLSENGLNVTVSDVTKVNWIIGVAMLIGLIVALLFSYRKDREYKSNIISSVTSSSSINIKLNKSHFICILAIVVMITIQFIYQSLPFAALCGLIVMILFRTIKWKDIDNQLSEGIRQMGFIAFVMLIAGGYANVLKATGGINALVDSSMSIMNGSKLLVAIIVTLIGLVVTMGIGTSFGTVPVLAVIYVPLCQSVGFSTAGTILLVSAAAALGDAGSPASDTTLGPTAGLNCDNQHDHIWDTCVPTFFHYNVPIMIAAIVFSQFI